MEFVYVNNLFMLLKAITVAATSNTDARWSSSNYGSCVDIFAPGVNIRSAYAETPEYPGNEYWNLKTGTSMACPHVSGRHMEIEASFAHK